MDDVAVIPDGPGTTPQRVAGLLRAELLDGTIPAGARVREEELVQRFGIGRHSARAAITLLAGRGLVVHEPNRGAVVPPLTLARIDDVCGYRSVLEIGALRLALARGADLSPVTAAVGALEDLAARFPEPPWGAVMAAHAAVHRAVVDAAGNPHLSAAWARCEDEVRVLLAALRPEYDVGRLAELHRRLHDQLTAGPDAAERALREDLEDSGRAGLVRAFERQRATPPTRPGPPSQEQP